MTLKASDVAEFLSTGQPDTKPTEPTTWDRYIAEHNAKVRRELYPGRRVEPRSLMDRIEAGFNRTNQVHGDGTGQLREQVTCPICRQLHDKVRYNGTTWIGCPEIPEGFFFPVKSLVAFNPAQTSSSAARMFSQAGPVLQDSVESLRQQYKQKVETLCARYTYTTKEEIECINAGLNDEIA